MYCLVETSHKSDEVDAVMKNLLLHGSTFVESGCGIGSNSDVAIGDSHVSELQISVLSDN